MIHFFDVVSVNARLLFRANETWKEEGRQHNLEFLLLKIKLAEYLKVMEDDGMSENNDVPPMCTPLPVDMFRYAIAKHLPSALDLNIWIKCQHPECKKKTRVKCIPCNLYLCLSPEDSYTIK